MNAKMQAQLYMEHQVKSSPNHNVSFTCTTPPNNIAEDCVAARGPGLRSGKYAGFPTEADKINVHHHTYTVFNSR